MRRQNGCIVFGFLAWAIGLATVFSFNIWSDVTPLAALGPFADMNLFALIDYFTANLMMPVGAILMAVFVGWLVKTEVLRADLDFGSDVLFKIWLWMIRVVVPVAILGVLFSSL